METTLQPQAANQTRCQDGFWAAEQLSRIEPFIQAGRQYGFAVTATPAALRLLEEGGHEDAAHLALNICPVDCDPWQDQDDQLAGSRKSASHRARIGFVVSLVGATVCAVEAIERLASIIGTPSDAPDRLALVALFALIATTTRPGRLSAKAVKAGRRA